MREVLLSKPIQAHGETIDRITLREPTGADVAAVGGLPFEVIDLEADMPRPIGKPMRLMISRLAAIPPPSVDMMSMQDWTVAAMAVIGFLGVAPPARSSTGISSAPTGGATSPTS